MKTHPINVPEALALKIATYTQRQIIRAPRQRCPIAAGDMLHIYTRLRQPGCTLLVQARCMGAQHIHVGEDWFTFGEPPVVVRDMARLDEFAKLDGFGNWAEMMKFYKDNHIRLPRILEIIFW